MQKQLLFGLSFKQPFRKSSADQKDPLSNKLLKSILIFTFLLIAAVFIIIYVTIRSHTLSRIYDNELELASNISYSATIMQDEANNTLRELYATPQISQLIYSFNTERIETSRALTLLKNYVTNSSWIDSVYIYNAKDDIFIYSYSATNDVRLSFRSSSEFYDTAIFDLFSTETPVHFPVMRTLCNPSGVNQTVFTYAVSVSNARDSYDGFFVINISANKLLELSNGFTGSQDRQFLVASNADSFYTSNQQVLSEEDRGVLLERIFTDDETSGQYIIKRADAICTWNKASDSQLCFISCVPYSQVSRALNPLLYWYLLFFIIIVLFSVSDVLLLSRKIRTYETLQEKYDRVSKQYESNHSIIKNTVLRNYLILDSDKFVIGNQFRDNGIELEDFANYSITLINITQRNTEEGFSGIPYHTRYAILYDTFQRSIPANIKFEVVDMLQGRYLLITEYTDADMLNGLLQEQLALFASENTLAFSCLSYLNVADLSELPRQYALLSKKIEMLFFYPQKRCVLLHELTDRAYVGFEKAESLCPQLQLLWGKQSFAEAETLLGHFFDTWYEPLEKVSKTLNLLVSNLEEFITAFQYSYTLTMDFDRDSFMHSLRRCSSSLHIKICFSNLLTDLNSAFESVGNRSSYVDQIIDMIHEKYSDANLTISSISDALGISQSYTQAVFKAHTGTSVSTYLRQVRMENAKELLVTTNEPITEIAKKIGLNNTNYFFTSFKKQYALTPSEYRSRYKQIG